MSSATVKRVLAAQGAYSVVTGVAPFVSRRAFESVTGPKVDWWLVQTVGGLVAVAGAGLLSATRRDQVTGELIGIAAGSAAVLGSIDVVHVARGRIAPTYLLDAAAQFGFLAALAAVGRADRTACPSAPEADA